MKITTKQSPNKMPFNSIFAGETFILNDNVFMKIAPHIVLGTSNGGSDRNAILMDSGISYRITETERVHRADCELIVPKIG